VPQFYQPTRAFTESKQRAMDYSEQQRASAGSFLGGLITGASKVAGAWVGAGSPTDTASLLQTGAEVAGSLGPGPQPQVPSYEEPLPEIPKPPQVEPPPAEPQYAPPSGFSGPPMSEFDYSGLSPGSGNPFMDRLQQLLRQVPRSGRYS
jgi:hypothetical protein